VRRVLGTRVDGRTEVEGCICATGDTRRGGAGGYKGQAKLQVQTS
jgi:hypothetical protein